jgi:hypothetical protein
MILLALAIPTISSDTNLLHPADNSADQIYQLSTSGEVLTSFQRPDSVSTGEDGMKIIYG